MSMATVQLIRDEIDTDQVDEAVAGFAQILANGDSSNFSIAQQAHEDMQAMRLDMGSDFDAFLAQSLQFMYEQDLRPSTFEE